MKKSLLLGLFLMGITSSVNAQVTVFEDSFEAYTDFAIANVGAWTLIDVDMNNPYFIGTADFPNISEPRSFMVFNATTTVPPLTPTADSNWAARTGNKHMLCIASQGVPTPPALNNDWLISPQIALGTSNNILTFWAKSCSTEYGAEKFKVGISAGNTQNNVTLLSAGTVTTAANATWTLYSYTIPASYNNQQVYLSINCVSDDQFGFAIDDFKVTATSLGKEDFFKTNFAVYPNPANDVINISNVNDLEISNAVITDINGRIIKNVKSVTQSINIADLNAGVYFLRISTASGEGVSKIVKN